jgi:choline kinase
MSQSESSTAGLVAPPAVILAAGQGQRLNSQADGGLKPLTPLLGLTLLERAALACQTAGAADCYIVVGYQHEVMRGHIEALSRRYRMRLHTVANPHWQAGNGTSARAVGPYIQGDFWLLMCDHVFDCTILTDLLSTSQTSGDCLLAVDPRTEEIFDSDDATKVRLNGRRITAIGKELAAYDAIDTGLFLCRPALFQALEQAQAAGDDSLSGGIRQLIAAGGMQAVSIGKRFWMDIDTHDSLIHAEQTMLAALTSQPESPPGTAAPGTAIR